MENGVGYSNHEFVPPIIKRSSPDSRFPVNAGITGYVAATGETLNIIDAYKDPRFDSVSDHFLMLWHILSVYNVNFRRYKFKVVIFATYLKKVKEKQQCIGIDDSIQKLHFDYQR
jgi:hypothetical protein